MPCLEKARLVEEYHRAALEYSRAVRELHSELTTSTASEHELSRETANNAFVKCKAAHLAVEKHVTEHGC